MPIGNLPTTTTIASDDAVAVSSKGLGGDAKVTVATLTAYLNDALDIPTAGGGSGGGDLLAANNLSELAGTAAVARANLGLGAVDNTSDATKPVSTLQAAADTAVLNAASADATAKANARQAPLVSGTNIKTVNGNSLLGSGNLTITGGASGFLGDILLANIATLTGGAVAGSTCRVTDVGTDGSLYEYTGSVWQPLQGSIGASLISLVVVPGKVPRKLRVFVAAATQVTVTIEGTTVPFVLIPATLPYVFLIYDEYGVAPPSAATVQRTTGTATTGWFSLE